MGLCINYTVRLGRRSQVAAFLRAARREAAARRWEVRRNGPATTFAAVPHDKCEEVRLAFASALTWEDSVKTSGAPLRTHVEIVEFFRALEPLARSLEIEDECEYWETGDRRVLKRHRDDFARAAGGRRGKGPAKPMRFTLGAVVISPR